MRQIIDNTLEELRENGNFRTIPMDFSEELLIDLSSNDYLGIASRKDLREEFFSTVSPDNCFMSASASRLLARRQKEFNSLEDTLNTAYRRKTMLFNSGYHANTGLVSALADKNTLILADKLVHASIIDGIRLSGAAFERFRHNDCAHLARLAEKAMRDGRKILIIAESVYSMDGDKADIEALAGIKRRCPGAMLYVDEAHAVGVEGEAGLGLCYSSPCYKDIDIVVGTFGKALGSIGAYAVTSENIRHFAINKSRSFIFSTALPPVNAMWSKFTFLKALDMDSERARLKKLGQELALALLPVGGNGSDSHIQPLVLGDPKLAVDRSEKLRELGYAVLPIRTPTVPPGTDRLRFSLSAAIPDNAIANLSQSLSSVI